MRVSLTYSAHSQAIAFFVLNTNYMSLAYRDQSKGD